MGFGPSSVCPCPCLFPSVREKVLAERVGPFLASVCLSFLSDLFLADVPFGISVHVTARVSNGRSLNPLPDP